MLVCGVRFAVRGFICFQISENAPKLLQPLRSKQATVRATVFFSPLKCIICPRMTYPEPDSMISRAHRGNFLLIWPKLFTLAPEDECVRLQGSEVKVTATS